jgi:phytoene dehydrogenase-like protein
VLSAADGHATLFDMLGGRYVNAGLADWYENAARFPSYIQVSLGVARTFPGMPRALVFPLPEPLRVDPETQADRLDVQIYGYDPTLAPEGGTVLAAILPTGNDRHWTALREADRGRYAAEKERLARAVIAALDGRFGDVACKVEASDVSTPATVVRYTRNWRGSFEGWLLTPETGFRQLKQTLPGLGDFWMAGHWVSPGGGLPSALLTGRNAAQLMCRAHGVPFRTGKA